MSAKPNCVIFDIDGTIADNSHRLYLIQDEEKDWTRYFENCVYDDPIWSIINTLKWYQSEGAAIVFSSGRAEFTRQSTKTWLEDKAEISAWSGLYMRPENDYRSSVDLKRGMLHVIKQSYTPILAVDDNMDDVRMYFNNNVPCWRVI